MSSQFHVQATLLVLARWKGRSRSDVPFVTRSSHCEARRWHTVRTLLPGTRLASVAHQKGLGLPQLTEGHVGAGATHA